MKHHRKMQLACMFSALFTITIFGVLPGAAQARNNPAVQAVANTSQFRGVNWADPRDNYANDAVVPSGLSTADSYATTYAKASAIISGFASNLGSNTVRLPINPYTVNGTFWSSYTGAIDSATAHGFKVILSYWEGIPHTGTIQNMTAWWTMWQTVVNKYGGNNQVYFEAMNEPYGYSQSAWADIEAQWISTYPAIPRNRIFVSGTGYNDNVTTVCADSRLNGTFLSLHHYGFWNTGQTSIAGWVSDLANRIGSCASRTVADEWGASMTTGLNYDGAVNGSYEVAYIQADSAYFATHGIGSVYWPGLRNGDTYSMETLNGSGTSLYLTNNNASGVDRLKYAYGLTGTGYFKLVNRNSGLVLDINGASTANGAQAIQWPYSGGANQQWLEVPLNGGYELVNRNSGLAFEDPGFSSTAGTQMDQWSINYGTNQWWNLVSAGNGYYYLVNQASGLYADISGGSTKAGAAVIQWSSNGGTNQQWQLATVSILPPTGP